MIRMDSSCESAIEAQAKFEQIILMPQNIRSVNVVIEHNRVVAEINYAPIVIWGELFDFIETCQIERSFSQSKSLIGLRWCAAKLIFGWIICFSFIQWKFEQLKLFLSKKQTHSHALLDTILTAVKRWKLPKVWKLLQLLPFSSPKSRLIFRICGIFSLTQQNFLPLARSQWY